MKIITSTFLKDFTNKNLELSVGKSIASILGGSKSHDPLKAYILATKFYSEGEVEVDTADLKFIKDTVKTNEAFTPVVTGQLLQILEDIKEAK